MKQSASPSDPTPATTSGEETEEHTFAAELWQWDARRHDTWVFVTLPKDITAAVENEADSRGPRAGFGSVKVSVRIAATVWRTSVFPDSGSGCFVLPVKRSVRRVAGIEVGDTVIVHLRTI